MKPAERDAVKLLRDAGYAVALWHPEELGTVNPRELEARIVELAVDEIDQLAQDEIDLALKIDQLAAAGWEPLDIRRTVGSCYEFLSVPDPDGGSVREYMRRIS